MDPKRGLTSVYHVISVSSRSRVPTTLHRLNTWSGFTPLRPSPTPPGSSPSYTPEEEILVWVYEATSRYTTHPTRGETVTAPTDRRHCTSLDLDGVRDDRKFVWERLTHSVPPRRISVLLSMWIREQLYSITVVRKSLSGVLYSFWSKKKINNLFP